MEIEMERRGGGGGGPRQKEREGGGGGERNVCVWEGLKLKKKVCGRV